MLLTLFLIHDKNIDGWIITMLLWDVFSFTYIITSWIVFCTRQTSSIRKFAQMEDGSSLFVFILIIFTSIVSMGIVIVLIRYAKTNPADEGAYLAAAISGVVFSWVIVHTTFAFHYTHKYYGDDNEDKTRHAQGLVFPGDKNPDYRDFAYYAFVIGMTFQVSDVQITSKQIRRITLLHGLISFALNAAVLAVTVNIIAGL